MPSKASSKPVPAILACRPASLSGHRVRARWSSTTRVSPSQLADKTLYDFFNRTGGGLRPTDVTAPGADEDDE